MLSDQTLQCLKKDTYVEHFGDLRGGETFQVANAVLDSIQDHLVNLFLKEPGDTDVLRGHAREKFSAGCVFVKRLRANLNPLGRGKDYPKSPSFVPDQELKDKIYPSEDFLTGKLDYTQDQLINAESWICIHTKWGEYFSPGKMLSEEAGKERYEWPIPDLAGICVDYLKTPWLQCQEVDLIIVRSLIYAKLIEFAYYLRESAFPRTTYLWSKPDQMTWAQNCTRREWKIAIRNSLQNWGSLALGVGASLTTVWWVGPLVWYGMLNLLWTRSVARYANDERRNVDLFTKWRELCQVFYVAGSNFVSPEYLQRRLIDIENVELRFSPVIFQILDIANSRRDPQWGIRNEHDFLDIAQRIDKAI